MSGHTPGPWSATEFRNGGFEINGGGKCIDDGRMVIASRGAIDFRAEESLSNARLIAAAPDLMAALEGIIDQACVNGCPEYSHADGEQSCVVHTEACNAARAAIRKANGE